MVVRPRITTLTTTLALLLIAAPLIAKAQQAGKVPMIAFISTTSPESSPTSDAFRQGLRDLGYVEGRNIRIEWQWGRGSTERFPAFAAEAVRLNVDVIVAANDAGAREAQKLTRTIPIVVAIMGDPVGSGFVASLARPGGNITGLTTQGPELSAKRLQLLKETLPRVSRVALIADTNDRSYRQALQEAEVAARLLGLQLQIREVSNPGEFDGIFAGFAKNGAGAVALVGGTMLYANRAKLAEQALRSHMPMICGSRESVQAGCLMSYQTHLVELFRRAATYVDKILKGTKPADLPVEQPTKFELVINLTTAKALGLTIPASVLARTDQVIE
jgi:putative ABC transport system substrate-binding protein